MIAVGINIAKTEGAEGRLEAIRKVYAGNPRVEVRSYNGLTADIARELGVCAILRGVRSVRDFEYERDMADLNRQLSGIETVLLYSLPEYAAISSSAVRELEAYGKDVSRFLP